VGWDGVGWGGVGWVVGGFLVLLRFVGQNLSLA